MYVPSAAVVSLLLAHGGHPDLGVLHALWHTAPWLLGVALVALAVKKRSRGNSFHSPRDRRRS